jgi:hypothetical protein
MMCFFVVGHPCPSYMPYLYIYLHAVSNLSIPLYRSNVEGMCIEIFIHTQKPNIFQYG